MTKQIKIGALLAFAIIVGAFLFFAVSSTQAPIVGNDKDANGCIGSAGYSWCEAKKECIRSWEEYCTSAEAKLARFTCKDSRSIEATFYLSDDKYVDLVFGEKKVSLPRAMSGSGARYANEDESLVFWNKGDTAFITENGVETFSGCALLES